MWPRKPSETTLTEEAPPKHDRLGRWWWWWGLVEPWSSCWTLEALLVERSWDGCIKWTAREVDQGFGGFGAVDLVSHDLSLNELAFEGRFGRV